MKPAISLTPSEHAPYWDLNAWEDYLWWQTQDRKVLKRINLLTQDAIRDGNEGLGKPGPLKHDFAGYWSRRITDEHRLVYKVAEPEVRIAACRYHYGRWPKTSIQRHGRPLARRQRQISAGKHRAAWSDGSRARDPFASQVLGRISHHHVGVRGEGFTTSGRAG